VLNHDLAFRPILVAGVLAVILVTGFHRIKAGTREPLDRRQEGLFILWTLRPVAFFLWGGVIAFLINPAWMAWSSVALPVWVRWAGVGMCVATVGLLFWTLSSLGPNLTDTVVTRRAHTLVTRGPYRWVRHPFYDCFALLMIGNALAASNWFMLVTGVMVLLLLVVRTRTEEANMVARFGEPYRVYMTRTGRFLPWNP
jgi:protein-S-isoprenylcysteine O-methyltransferase Ste14